MPTYLITDHGTSTSRTDRQTYRQYTIANYKTALCTKV